MHSQTPLPLRQAGLLLISAYLSAAVHSLPAAAALLADRAALLVPAAGFLLFLPAAFCLFRLFRGEAVMDLAEKIPAVLGPRPGRAVLGAAALCFTLLAALCSRRCSFQLTSTVFPNVRDPIPALLLMLPAAAVMAGGMGVLSRMNGFVACFVPTVLLLVILGLLRHIEPDRLLFVTPDLLPGVGRAALAAAGHWMLALTPLFAAPFAADRPGGKTTLRTSLFLLAVGSLVVAVTVGTLSAPMVNRLSQPFLFAVKQIEINGSLQKAEALIVSLWILSDFVQLTLCSMAGLRLLSRALGRPAGRAAIPLYLGLVYLFSLGLSTAPMELTYLTVRVFLPAGALLGSVLLFLLLAADALRRPRPADDTALRPARDR